MTFDKSCTCVLCVSVPRASLSVPQLGAAHPARRVESQVKLEQLGAILKMPGDGRRRKFKGP